METKIDAIYNHNAKNTMTYSEGMSKGYGLLEEIELGKSKEEKNQLMMMYFTVRDESYKQGYRVGFKDGIRLILEC